MAPGPVAEEVSPLDIPLPLTCGFEMLPSVVLHDQLQVGVAEVETETQPAVLVVHLHVHLWFRQSGEDDQHPQPGLHG